MCLCKRVAAEFIGTFWLVLGGCGAAVLACNVPGNGIGYLGVALAFGLTVLTMAFAIGHISGCHLNPAVTLGLLAAGRFKGAKDTVAYIIAQCAGGVLAATVIYIIIGAPDLANTVGSFATNGWSESLGADGLNAFGGKTFGMGSAFLIEAVLTCVFLLVIIGATDKRAPAGLAPVAIGLCLTLIHLIAIPVTNTSVNPARSTAVAVFVGSQPLSQLWLFWVAPIIGAIVAGILYKCVFEAKSCCGNSECKCDPCKCDASKCCGSSKSDASKCEIKCDASKCEIKCDASKCEVSCEDCKCDPCKCEVKCNASKCEKEDAKEDAGKEEAEN